MFLQSGSFRSGKDLPGEYESKCSKRSDSLHLAQEIGFMRVVIFSDGFQLALIVADTLCQRADLLQDGPESRQKRLGYVL
jgi:hypothetical protein